MPSDSSKGPWTADEDAKLKDLVGNQGINQIKWSMVASHMAHRNSKQCAAARHSGRARPGDRSRRCTAQPPCARTKVSTRARTV